MVYIRKFSTVGSEMVLLNTLQGHFGEVISVCWNPVKNVWVTGSDDGTIRIWVSSIILNLHVRDVIVGLLLMSVTISLLHDVKLHNVL